MSALALLGINSTIFIHVGIFTVLFFFITYVLFVPYAKALALREERTKGGAEIAQELAQQTADLKQRYETVARKVNGEIKTIYDGYRSDAQKEQERLIQGARTEAQTMINKAKSQIESEIGRAREQLQKEVPALAHLMVTKLLSKKA